MSEIPITLTPIPVPVETKSININQLLQIISQYIKGSIDVAGVSFFIQGAVDPQSDQGLFYNTAAKTFKVWNTSTGTYVPIFGPSGAVGDTKLSFVAGDEPTVGWVVLDGRAVSAVIGLSQVQKNNLQVLFGVSGNLPTFATPAVLTNLPTNGTIGNINVPTIKPAAGVIGGLPINAVYSDTEVKDLRDKTEELDDSTIQLAAAVTSLRDKTEQLRDALADTGSATPSYYKVWVGYP